MSRILVDVYDGSAWIDEDMKLPFKLKDILEVYLNDYEVLSHRYYTRSGYGDLLEIVWRCYDNMSWETQ